MKVFKRLLPLLLVPAIFLCGPSASAQVPVIPGAHGFGITTPAGRGGQVFKVTNLNDGGPGSLRACAEADMPRICVFEVSGVIRLNSEIVVRHPYLTIAGQTAPSPGIIIRGWSFIIYLTHDVLIQHLHFRPGDNLNGSQYCNRDGLGIAGWSGADQKVYNIVIDHSSFSWSIDETLGVWAYWDNITFNNNIFAEPLHDSFHPLDDQDCNMPPTSGVGPHGFGPLIAGEYSGRVSMIGNLFASSIGRNPSIGAPQFFFANNVIYNAVQDGTQLETRSGTGWGPMAASMVSNVYIHGPDDWGGRDIGLSASPGVPIQLYLSDIDSPLVTSSDPWVGAVTFFTGWRSNYEVSSPPVWLSGFTPTPTANNAVKNAVLANAGARPADRDSVDVRIIDGVRNKTGRYLNCVSDDGSARCAYPRNAGGWPSYEERYSALALPSNPNTLNSDGYTTLEKWLHSYSAKVENGAQPPPATQPTSTVFSTVDSYLGDRTNWTERSNGSNWAIVNDGGARYGITLTDYSNLSGSRLGAYSLINRSYNDFTLTMRAKSTEDFTANAGADYDVVFGYQDERNYYYMMFNYTASLTQLFKVVNGERLTIATTTRAVFSDNAYHTVQVARSGTLITVRFDGAQIVVANDSTFAAGQVGIGSFNDAAYFDDITVVPNQQPTSVVIEAETMNLSHGYSVEGGFERIYLGNPSKTTGYATRNFSGPSGRYDVQVHVFGESDGTPLVELYRNSNRLGYYYFQPGTEPKPVSSASRQIFTIPNVSLANGDFILIVGYAQAGAAARVDKIVFVPK